MSQRHRAAGSRLTFFDENPLEAEMLEPNYRPSPFNGIVYFLAVIGILTIFSLGLLVGIWLMGT